MTKRVTKISAAMLVVLFLGAAGFYLQLKDYQKARLSIWMDQQFSGPRAD